MTIVSLPTGQALLTPFAEPGSVFAGWGGTAGCTGSGACLLLPPAFFPVETIPVGPQVIPLDGPSSATDESALTATAFFATIFESGVTLMAWVNEEQFGAGQTLDAAMGILNTGLSTSAQLYVGILRPNSDVEFFTGQSIVLGHVTDFASFRPFAMPPGPLPTRTVVPDLHSHVWTGNDQKGAYFLAVVALKAGAFDDGVVTQDEILSLVSVPFEYLDGHPDRR